MSKSAVVICFHFSIFVLLETTDSIRKKEIVLL